MNGLEWLFADSVDDLPLGYGLYDEGRPQPKNDDGSKLKPKGGGKEVKVEDYGPAIRKMLKANAGKSQYGMHFEDPKLEAYMEMFNEQDESGGS